MSAEILNSGPEIQTSTSPYFLLSLSTSPSFLPSRAISSSRQSFNLLFLFFFFLFSFSSFSSFFLFTRVTFLQPYFFSLTIITPFSRSFPREPAKKKSLPSQSFLDSTLPIRKRNKKEEIKKDFLPPVEFNPRIAQLHFVEAQNGRGREQQRPRRRRVVCAVRRRPR